MGLSLSEVKDDLLKKKFIRSLIRDCNAEIYFVGGIVRDLLLGKKNKDIDLVVRNVNIDKLITELSTFGRVDIVGKSFGIIKFKSFEDDVEYDIALPRQEVPTGQGGHKGFTVAFDEKLSIEKDLVRRDAKINAMAVRINDGEFFDPLGGMKDITDEKISMANPASFSDDPLRMLRVIGFASRFKFFIEEVTLQEIKNHAERISEISTERILIEFDKIVKKGEQKLAAYYLFETGIMQVLMGNDARVIKIYDGDLWNHSRTLGEFIYLLTYKSIYRPAEWYKNKMKGDIETYNELVALDHGNSNLDSMFGCRMIINSMYKKSPKSINSLIISDNMIRASDELNAGMYPLSLKEMKLNGDDLIEMGYIGREIGDILNFLLIAIYNDTLQNDKEELRNFVIKKFPKD